MRELAILTQIQGEQINTIEIAIDSAKGYVEQAETKLEKAKVYYKKSQKVYLLLMIENMLYNNDSDGYFGHNIDPCVDI